MAPPTAKLNPVFIRMENWMLSEVDKLCELDERSRAAVVRMLLREALKARKQKMQPA